MKKYVLILTLLSFHFLPKAQIFALAHDFTSHSEPWLVNSYGGLIWLVHLPALACPSIPTTAPCCGVGYQLQRKT